MSAINNYLIGGNMAFLKVCMPESIDIDNINDLKICRKLDIKI